MFLLSSNTCLRHDELAFDKLAVLQSQESQDCEDADCCPSELTASVISLSRQTWGTMGIK